MLSLTFAKEVDTTETSEMAKAAAAHGKAQAKKNN